MSAPFFFFFFEKKTVLFCQCLCLVVSFIRARGGPHPQKAQKPPKGQEGAKGQKRSKTPRSLFRTLFEEKKREKRRKLTPNSRKKKKKKRRTHTAITHFLNERDTRSFLLPVFGYFFQGSLSFLPPYLLPFCCRAVVKRERERERERVKGREEEEDFVHTFF